jgi:transcriptional regulator with XRE-family HTH domain
MAKSAKKAPLSPADAKKSAKRSKPAEAVPTTSARLAIPKRSEAARGPELELESAAEFEPGMDKAEPAVKAKPSKRATETPRAEINPTLARVGQIIKKTRKEQGLTQMQLAERCKFNPAAIFMAESGRQNMTIKSLMTLAAALGLEVGDLFPRTTPNTSAKLEEVADSIRVLKGRVVMQLQGLDRLASELNEEAGVLG